MKRLVLLIGIWACAMAAIAQSQYETMQIKADRFFYYHEWGSAAASYNYLLQQKPNNPDNYGRAIVSYEMLDQEDDAMHLLDQAMNHGVPLDSVLLYVRKYSFQLEQGNLYEEFMLDAAKTHTWLERPLDAYLMRYYTFRRNGPKMMEYAQKMLKGTPNSVPFMQILAEGQMLCDYPYDAVGTWLHILKLDPENYLTLLNLANYFDMAEEKPEALEYFKRAYAIRPTPFVREAIHRLEPKKKH